jgi:hypothetical protein
MKQIFLKFAAISLSLLLTGGSIALSAQNGTGGADEVLTNERVTTLVKAGLSPAIIVSKIRSSKTNFNTSTDELIRLKQAQIPDEIVAAMFDASRHASSVSSSVGAGDASKADPNDPSAAHEAGIYWYQEKGGQKTMTQLEPSISKQTKTGGVFTSAMTAGLTKIKFKAALSGQNAPMQIDEGRPVFYFYFEVKNAGLSSNTYYATSPNEFVLVRLDQKVNTREVTVSQANAFGAQSGTMDKAARGMKVEKLGPGMYKVMPQDDLTEGEYAFYNGGGAGPSGGAKLFDFGIRTAR